MSRQDPGNEVLVLLTSRCDLRCAGCVFGDRLGFRDLSARATDHLVEGLDQHSIVTLAGGEPTLHPDFFGVIAKIAARSPKLIQVITNGRSFTNTPQKARSFFQRLKEAAGQTPVAVAMSVDDHHVHGTGAENELVARAKLFREAGAHVGVGHSFCVHDSTVRDARLSMQSVSEKYGLPLRASGHYFGVIRGGEWHSPSQRRFFGTIPKAFVSWTGEVHGSQSAFVSDARPLGNLEHEPLSAIRPRLYRGRF